MIVIPNRQYIIAHYAADFQSPKDVFSGLSRPIPHKKRGGGVSPFPSAILFPVLTETLFNEAGLCYYGYEGYEAKFAERELDEAPPLLMAEVKRFRHDYPDESFEQFPLPGLNIMYGNARRPVECIIQTRTAATEVTAVQNEAM